MTTTRESVGLPLRAGLNVRRRIPLAALVPGMDALALVAAIALVQHVDLLDPIGISYVILTLLVLNVSERERINPRLSDDVGWLLGRISIPLLAVLPFARGNPQVASFLALGSTAAALVALGRATSYGLTRAARARGLVFEPTVILGAGPIGVQVATTLQEHPEFGLVPIGFLDALDGRELPLPLLGESRELESVVRGYGVSRVIVAFGSTREPELVRILRTCDELPVDVHLVPRFFELGMAPEGSFTDDLWGIPLVRLNRSALSLTAWRLKRVFDVLLGSLFLILASPIMLLGAIAVRLSSPGPIFFRQRRVGRHGEAFELLKFRTMRVNEDSDVKWSDEARVTAAGRVLRRTSVDELPQLFNVIKGQMSLVGPRPERPHFVDQFSSTVPRYEDRHRVPVGITGWAQVHGLRGADSSISDRVRFDNYYIEHWSLWRDLIIIARTVKQILTAGGQ